MGELGSSSPATFRSVFAVREFRALWLAELLSVVGDQLARVALSILVLERTNSAGLTALTYALTYLPDIVGGPLLAGLADRFPRRRVMIVADVLRVVLVGGMAVPGMPLPIVAVLLVAARLCNSPFASAQAATLPIVLTGDRYVIGQTVRQVTNQTAQLAGFAVGGGLVATLGASNALAVDAATFLLSAALIAVGVRPRPAPARDAAAPSTMVSQLAEGARIIWHDPRLRALTFLAWLAGFGIVPEGLAAPYANEIGGGDVAVGLLLAAHPAGLVVGAFVLGRWVDPARRLALLGVLPVLTLVPLLGYGLRPGLWVTMCLLFVSGAFAAYHVTASATFIQLVPDAGRGQAFGLAGSGLIAAQGLGLIAGGVLVSVLGSVPAAVVTAAAVGIVVAVPAVLAWRRSARPGRNGVTLS